MGASVWGERVGMREVERGAEDRIARDTNCGTFWQEMAGDGGSAEGNGAVHVIWDWREESEAFL